MTVSRLQPFPLHLLPVDVMWQIGVLLSARGFASLLQLSKTFYQAMSIIREAIARSERDRIRILSNVVPLNVWQIASQWGQLTPEEARVLRINLASSPPMFYAGIDPAMVVLREPFLAARNNQPALSSLAGGHLDLRQAAILANQIKDEQLKATTLHTIVQNALNEYLPENENAILELIATFLPANKASKVLRQLLLMTDMPLEKIKKILEWIPIPKQLRDKILRDLAKKNGTEVSKAIEIAGLIQDRKEQDETLRHIALRDDIAPKNVLYILGLLIKDLNDPEDLDAPPDKIYMGTLDKKLVKALKNSGFFNKTDFSANNIFKETSPLNKKT